MTSVTTQTKWILISDLSQWQKIRKLQMFAPQVMLGDMKDILMKMDLILIGWEIFCQMLEILLMHVLRTVQIRQAVSATHSIEMEDVRCTFRIIDQERVLYKLWNNLFFMMTYKRLSKSLMKDQRKTRFGARETNELSNLVTLNDHARTKNFHLLPNTLEHQDSFVDF